MQDALPSYDDNAMMQDQPRFALDHRLYVTFFRRAVMNPFKSSQEGRPIFDEKDMVRIIIPGDKHGTVETVATREHTEMRFPKQWENYKRGLEQAATGTPLEHWPQMTVGQVAEFKAMHITTVEQLADLSDTLAQKFMGSHMIRQKAKAFLELAKGDSANTKLAAELQKRDDEINALKEQMRQFLEVKSKQPDVPSFGKHKG